MKKTCNNCFRLKNRSMTFCREKADKHECQNVKAMYKTKYNEKILIYKNTLKKIRLKHLIKFNCCYISALMLVCFCLMKGRIVFFKPKQLLQIYCTLWFYFSK